MTKVPLECRRPPARVEPKRGAPCGAQTKCRGGTRGGHGFIEHSIYFVSDFLNMRSIFSLSASIAAEFDCALAKA
jgi:hypothetical protein